MALDVRTIGLICIIGGAILFARQIIRRIRGKETRCDCGDLFPRSREDSQENEENKN